MPVTEAMRLRVIRAIIDWDMKTMSQRIGVHPGTIRAWECGRSTPNHRSRAEIAKICHESGIAVRPDGFPVVEVVLVDKEK